MKAEFENIGPVKQRAGLELGDLTIIAGQNNTGKTYLVYTLYGYLAFLHGGELMSLRHTRAFNMKNYMGIITALNETGEASISLQKYRRYEKRLLEEASDVYSKRRLHQDFSVPREAFREAHFRLEVQQSSHIKQVTRFGSSMGIKYEIGIRQGAAEQATFFLNSKDSHSRVSDLALDGHFIFNGIIQLIIDQILAHNPEPFILSAERFGISLFYKELDFTKNRVVELLQNLDKEREDRIWFLDAGSARYAKPIKDNIDFIRDLSEVQKQKSELVTDKVRRVDNMIDGYYKAKSDEIRFVSRRRKEHRFDIPLHLASSSARGVCILYFYLKHQARLGQLLIIDEPESHLSPSNQVLMARLLAFCVNAGLKVLITTHSDYLIKEINNLIMLHGDFEGKADFLKKYKKEYTAEDHLFPGSVKAYACEYGTLTPCEVDRMGIDMPVFDDEIDKINEISMALALKKTTDGQRDD